MRTPLFSKKYLFLVFIVILEITLGFVFLYKKYLAVKTQKQTYVGKINKENVDFLSTPEPEFKHYFTLKPNTIEKQQPNWLTDQAVYTYNNDGLNDRFNYEVKKPANTFRIITLGDSFTYGLYVNTKDSWPEQLEDLMRDQFKDCANSNIEVINLGMPSFDIPYTVKRYKDIGLKYQADLIIWFDSGSGFDRFTELMFSSIQDCNINNISNIENTKDFEEYHHCWKLANQKVFQEHSFEELNTILKDNLNIFFSLVDNKKVIYLTFQTDWLGQREQQLLADWRQSYPEATFEPLIPMLKEEAERLADGHPNQHGHFLIAQNALDYLLTKKIVTCDAK